MFVLCAVSPAYISNLSHNICIGPQFVILSGLLPSLRVNVDDDDDGTIYFVGDLVAVTDTTILGYALL